MIYKLLDILEDIDFGIPPGRPAATMEEWRMLMRNYPEHVVGICGLFCETCPSFADGLCDGCLSDHVAKACVQCRHGFRDCAKGHGVTWCFECWDFPCKRLKDFKDCHVVNGISHHEHILEYVRRQREIGVRAWVEEQEALNACPDCGKLVIWCEKTCRSCGSNALWKQKYGRNE